MNDHQLRRALKGKVLARYLRQPDTRVIDELGLRHGVARVDIAVVNGIIHGYELKSDKDNLKRLPHQVRIYNSVLDKVTLVVGSRHAKEALKLVPGWWGIKVATMGPRGGLEFTDIRRACNNPSVDPLSVSKLLWRNEALNLLDELREADCVRHRPRAFIYAHLAAMADSALIRERVRYQLKFRRDWRPVSRQMSNGDLCQQKSTLWEFPDVSNRRSPS
jgi:hypothetical protein